MKKRNNRSSLPRYVANSAVLSALCCVILSMGTIIETLDLSFAAICSLVLWITLLEFGKKTAWTIYLVTSVIAILFIPSKFPALFFACITGWYPMIKHFLSVKIKKKAVLWLCKLGVFNISALFCLGVIYLLGAYLGISLEDEATKTYMIVMLSTANFAFVITDMLMDKLVIVYIYKLRDKLKKLRLIE